MKKPVELAALLDEIVEKQKVDQDRIYVTGLSMGGFGTWSLAAYQPKRFAAVVPIGGGGEPILAKLFTPIPAWVFHGAKDFVVPLERSKKRVEAMKQAGGIVKFTVYPEAGHDSWTESYANPESYDWLAGTRTTTTFLTFRARQSVMSCGESWRRTRNPGYSSCADTRTAAAKSRSWKTSRS